VVDAEAGSGGEFEGHDVGHGHAGGTGRGEELGEQQAGGSGAEYERAGPGPDLEAFDAVHGAGGGFGEHRGVGGQPVDGEHLAVVDGDVLGEEARVRAAQSASVRAEDEPARQAVVAVSAVDVRVDGDLLAEPEPGDTDTELVDDADDLVAGDEGEHGVEAAVVQVQVGAAHPDLGHLDPHLVRSCLR
jgi:hypothetical protein